MNDFELQRNLALLKTSSRHLATLQKETKNAILLKVADRLVAETAAILLANHEDLARISDSIDESHTPAFRDRLTLDAKRIEQMAESVRAVAKLDDPVGEEVESRILDNGLKIRRVRAPLGSILMIFESRPNVITEVFALAFKSGNAIALRGGTDSQSTACVLYRIVRDVLTAELTTPATVHSVLPFVGIEDYDRGLIGRLLQRDDIFDICIPRGGSALIDRVRKESRMPLIKNDKGVCHLYVHEQADIEMAVNIAINAKTQRPGVCNSIETVLVDRANARAIFAEMIPRLHSRGVKFYVCESSYKLLIDIAKTDGVESPWTQAVSPASNEDFYREYLDLKLNLKIVENNEFAIAHIEKFGSHHSETIVTANEKIARHFQANVDSACVYWNASTRFTDGFELGLGGEIGISTQKLHVRGPVGLRELTSVRWLIDGEGQVRA
ncbi:glutamate-5-semialdehyde dehydrogenase [soil metagenome]